MLAGGDYANSNIVLALAKESRRHLHLRRVAEGVNLVGELSQNISGTAAR